jgi:broad specificity phosphatase PhoE
MAMKGLQERGFGTWEGLTSKEIQENFPDEWQSLNDDPINFHPPGAESLADFSARVNDTMQLLLFRHPGQTILIVTHVGPIRMVVSAALGIPLENFKRLVVGYCSITEIEYTKSWPNLISFSRKPNGS